MKIYYLLCHCLRFPLSNSFGPHFSHLIVARMTPSLNSETSSGQWETLIPETLIGAQTKMSPSNRYRNARHLFVFLQRWFYSLVLEILKEALCLSHVVWEREVWNSGHCVPCTRGEAGTLGSLSESLDRKLISWKSEQTDGENLDSWWDHLSSWIKPYLQPVCL